MPEFWIVAVLLSVLALAFLCVPLLLRDRVNPQDERLAQTKNTDAVSERKKTNIDLYRDRLTELEADFRKGEMSEGEFATLRVELQQRLLDEVDNDPGRKAQSRSGRWPLVIVLSAAVPVFALWLYGHLGATPDLHIRDTLTAVQRGLAAGTSVEPELKTLQQQIEQRLRQHPDSGQYLMLAAQTAMQLSDYPAAVNAYAGLYRLNPQDAAIVGQYAQALYLASNNQLTEKVKALAQEALALDPRQSTVLGLLGIHYFEQGDFARAVDYWQQLLTVLDPQSPSARMIIQGIDEARKRAKAAGQSLAGVDNRGAIEKADKQGEQGSSAQEGANTVIATVALAEGIKAPPGATVFIYARAVNGPKMPLAVGQRLTVAQLPATVRLDDSMAMTPNFRMSSFDQVEVVARISSSGIANASSGDIEGTVGPVTLSAKAAEVSVTIDQVLP